jgi:prenyltransferase beta subunit
MRILDYKPRDLFDWYSFWRGEFKIIKLRNELRRKIAKEMNDRNWERLRKWFMEDKRPAGGFMQGKKIELEDWRIIYMAIAIAFLFYVCVIR